MADRNEWNTKIIDDFRANDGRVGPPFEGAPVVLLHHRGRKSGKEYVNPLVYLPDEQDTNTIYLFASKGGAPSNPDWYYNLTDLGTASVERGTDNYPLTVTEVTGDERDALYKEQASRFPGFGDYAQKTAGIRTIPVLKLTRA
jgi:deazaflavin-dependent oxidoreductase (nitroreductase family)